MSRKLWIICVLGMLAALLACSPAGQQAAVDEDAVAKEVKAATDASHAALVAGDVEGYLAAYMDDAVWMPPGSEKIVGKELARARLASMVPAVTIEGTYDIEEQTVLGPNGLAQRGEFNIVISPKSGEGKSVHEVGSFVNVWRRDTDGKWKIAMDIWNSDRGMTPAEKVAAGK